MSGELHFLILCEGQFGPLTSKTANSCIRYTPHAVSAVIDSRRAGKTSQQILGFGGAIPVVSDVAQGMAQRPRPNALLIGVAPTGGKLPTEWRTMILQSIENRLEIWNGLHTFIGDDPEFAARAHERGVAIHDLRKPPKDLPIASGRVRGIDATVVLTVGTDCNIGKMTSALQVRDALRARGPRVRFVGTGQTGILIEGWGTAVDAVIADFIAGAAERLVLDAAKDADIILVEGQGSVIHPGYSGVTMGLIHGSCPNALVMCHQPTRKHIGNNPWVKIPRLDKFIDLHDAITEPLRKAPTIAVALNTYDLSLRAAKAEIARTAKLTGLPTTDPVRFDPGPIADAIHRFHTRRSKKKTRT